MRVHASLRRRGKDRPGILRGSSTADRAQLADFVGRQRGVEAFLEPQTAVTTTTVVLIAASGEWTRRQIGSPQEARRFADRHAIPLYDAARVGYPARMREWDAHQDRRAG